MAAVAACLITLSGEADALVIDSFDADESSMDIHEDYFYWYYEGPGPIGGQREIWYKEGMLACCADIGVDAATGTVHFIPLSGGEGMGILYGSAIGTVPEAGYPSSPVGLPLELILGGWDVLEIDVTSYPTEYPESVTGLNVQLHSGQVLYTAAVDLSDKSSNLISVPMSDFSPAMPASVLVDGLSIDVVYTALMSVSSGLVLDEIRIQKTTHETLMQVDPLPVGDVVCPSGGLTVATGEDDGAGGGIADDGVLSDGEVDTSTPVCNGVDGSDGINGSEGAIGVDGTNGVDGANGYNSLLVVTPIDADGNECETGGILVEAGLDDGEPNGVPADNVLQAGEVDAAEVVCHGEDGVAGIDGINGADGATGVDGINGEDGADGAAGCTISNVGCQTRPLSWGVFGLASLLALMAIRRRRA